MAEANIATTQGGDHLEEGNEEEKMTSTVKEDSAMDVFLQRNRSELLYELRRIQHGDRPVTGQNHRENINSFFAKHLEVQAETEGKENVPANVDSVEEHRPESVVVEVQGLFEQQRVSSVLQSTAFRRSLERIISGSISAARAHNPAQSQATPARTSTPQTTQDDRSRAQSISSTASSSSSSSTENASTVHQPSPLAASDPSPRQAEAPAVQQWLPVRQQDNVDGTSPEQSPLTWQEVARVQHEDIIQEISELLHSRLVSSTLDGEFRGTLEVQMQNRLTSSGADGEQVANFIRNIPNTQPIPRNDFSHLGLPGPQDNWDNVSVTSISATAVPYTQSNLHLSREIHGLKAQMEEMKNMLKLTFDLQLDIQRAVRQEVAAAMAHAAEAPDARGASTMSAARSRAVDDTHCLICLDGAADSVLYQCGHMCLCYACGKHLLSRGGKCPVCRAPIRDVIRAYKCNDE